MTIFRRAQGVDRPFTYKFGVDVSAYTHNFTLYNHTGAVVFTKDNAALDTTGAATGDIVVVAASGDWPTVVGTYYAELTVTGGGLLLARYRDTVQVVPGD